MLTLPDRQLQIANRLRDFRAALKISRTAFAVTLGIGTERLASYEAARAPLRYEVFRLIHQHFRINPQWLATGQESPQSPPVDDSSFIHKLPRKALFTDAYDQFLKDLCHNRAMQARRDFVAFSYELQRVLDYISGPGADDMEFIAIARAKCQELRRALDEEIHRRDTVAAARKRRHKSR